MGKLSKYIGSQFGNPRGFVGKVCCAVSAIADRKIYKVDGEIKMKFC